MGFKFKTSQIFSWQPNTTLNWETKRLSKREREREREGLSESFDCECQWDIRNETKRVRYEKEKIGGLGVIGE